MFNKTIVVHLKPTDIELVDGELIKTAAVKLPDDVKYDPDFCYFLLRAVSAGEYYDDNKNGDYFPEEELKKYYTTFLKAHVFKNHENKDVKNSLGDVLRATWLDDMKQVELFVRVDRRIAPEIVRGIEKGYITDVSMGCRVAYSICSICGNKARTQREYCDHIKYMRRKILDDGKKVYEININPVFHDISIVLNGAEKVAKIEGIYIPNATEKKAATRSSLENEMLEKVASYHAPTPPKKINDFSGLINKSREVLASAESFGHLSKSEYLAKVADIQKEIEGSIVSGSMAEMLEDREEKSESVRSLLKSFTAKYLDEEEVSKIVKELTNIATLNRVSLFTAFNEFIKVLDFAGIELSPLEFNLFQKKIMPSFKPSEVKSTGISSSDIQKVDGECTNCEAPSLLSGMNAAMVAIKKSPELTPKVIRVIRTSNIGGGGDFPMMQNQIMDRLVSPIIPQRSLHPRVLVVRVKKIAPGTPAPVQVNQFAPYLKPQNSFDILGKLLYNAYQKDRLERLASGETQRGMVKYATYFGEEPSKEDMFLKMASTQKIAAPRFDYLPPEKLPESLYNTNTAIAFGYPIINVISKFERAKLSNGNRVSNFGRFIADYPADAYQFQSLFGPAAYAIAKNMAVKTGTGLVSSAKGIFQGSYSKYAPTPDMLKRASEECKKDNISFQNQKAIDMILNLREQNQDAAADKLMEKYEISEKDLKNYLQNKKKCYKMLLNDKVQKTASQIDSNEILKLPSEFGGVVGNAALVDFIFDYLS